MRRTLPIVALATLLGAAGAAPVSAQSAVDERLAPVVVDGEVLFSVRGVTAHPAELRAKQIADRIRVAAANPNIAPQSLTLEDHGYSTWILAGGQRLMALLDEDAAIEEAARAPLAELNRARIAQAIEAYRRDRRPQALAWSTAHALGATLLLLVVGYLGRRGLASLGAKLERSYHARLEQLQQRVFGVLKADQMWRAGLKLARLFSGAAAIMLLYLYVHYVLRLFPWTRGAAKALYRLAADPLRTIGAGLLELIPNLIFLAIVVVVTRFVLQLLRALVAGLDDGTIVFRGFVSEWAWPTFRLVRMLVIVLSVVVAYPYIPGSRSEAFKGVSLFMGVIFSLGSSSLIGNYIAGYSMTYRRAFHIGDRVKIGNHVGVVERTRLLVTHLRTVKNEEVVVPNSTILAVEVMNYSSMAREAGLILHTTVGIGYETPWRQVDAMLLEAAERTPGLLRSPSPFVLISALADYAVTYELNVYSESPDRMEEQYTELHRNILDLFNEYGVQIMTPSYESDPAEPKIVPKDQWYAAPAAPKSLAAI